MINFGAPLHLGFGLLLLWAAAMFFWRAIRLDYYRDELFAIRHELFILGATGQVSFGEPAYLQLRVLVNNLIRFAHKLSVTRLVLTTVLQAISPNPHFLDPTESWNKAISDLSPERREKLVYIHDRAMRTILRYVVVGAWPLLGLFWLIKGFIFLARLFGLPSVTVTALYQVRNREAAMIEAQAADEQEAEELSELTLCAKM